jgi:hypothetical protein
MIDPFSSSFAIDPFSHHHMSQVTSKLLVVGSAIQAIFGFAGVAAKADEP